MMMNWKWAAAIANAPFLASYKWTHKQQARLLSILLILYISCFITKAVDKSRYLQKLNSGMKLFKITPFKVRHETLIEVIGVL